MRDHRTTMLIGIALSGVAAPGHAQDHAEAIVPAEILVTAQRRSETLTQTPLAISAFEGDFITRARLDDVKDLVAYSPGFSGNSEDSYIDGLAIRGIVSNDYGIGGDPSIGIFKDGVHQGRTGSAVTSLFDIERAEALRGPQGFLFGRNAISGAISVITHKPELGRTNGYIDLGYGEPARREAEAAINVPLGERWAMRVAGYGVRADGWVDNAFTPGNDRIMGVDKIAGRLSLLYENGPFRVIGIAEHERRRLDGTPYRASNEDREVLDYLDQALGTHIIVRGRDNAIDSDLVDPRDDGSITSGTLHADLELGFATLTSISGYRGHTFYYDEDYDGTSLPLGIYRQRQSGSYASQEFRLVSPSAGALTWSFGISGYRETVKARFSDEADENFVCVAGFGYGNCEELTQDLFAASYVPAPAGMLVQHNHAETIATGLSAYGDLNYRAVPRIQIGMGLRYTWDRKRFALNIPKTTSSLGNIWTFPFYTDGFISAAKSWSGLTPRAYARWEYDKRLNLYASVTRGYKAGGFGTFTVEASSPIPDYSLVPAGTRPDAFDPETVWSKEVGAKGSLLRGRLRYDIAAFHYVYQDLQTNFYDTVTRTQQVINVGKVRGYGVETSLTLRASRYFDVMGNLAWTRTSTSGDRGCQSADCGGLPNPIWASSGVATARYPLRAGELYLSGEWSYQGRRREAFDWRGIARRDAYAVVNARVGYRHGERWEVSVYVQNLLDATYHLGATNGGDLSPSNTWGVAQPRNAGVNLRWQLGDS